MAVHAGEARVVDDGNYAGQAIIRAARLRSIAHGGQVLVSAAARDLTVDQLGDAVGLVDLGEHRLKDLARPEHVYQLIDAAIPDRFPAVGVAGRPSPQSARRSCRVSSAGSTRSPPSPACWTGTGW